MDRLTVMRSFVGVAHSSSFIEAAKSLGISGSLVSRHVAELERQVGIRLVNRTARSVTLTEAGARYADFAARILDEMDQEDAALHGLRDKPEGPLAVICPKWIGYLDAGDAVAAFSVAYPKIQIRFEVGGMSDRPHEFLDRGYDVAFHTKQVRDSNLMIKKVADLEFLVCAAPSYLDAHGEPQTPGDLLHHQCLVHTNYPIWHMREGERLLNLKITQPAFSSNSYLTLQKAVVAGRGISTLPVGAVLPDLREERLLPLLRGFQVPRRSLYAIYAPGRYTLARVRLFLDFMSDWFRAHPIQQSAAGAEDVDVLDDEDEEIEDLVELAPS
jgi:DNA-binding transcriptional LysR family regulator